MVKKMKNEISLIKDNEIKIVEVSEILVEVDDKSEFVMKLSVRKEEEKPLYRLCHLGESSRITFLKHTRFPDGVFFEIDDSNNIIFHVIEMKKAPTNNYSTLSKQLISGFIHGKTLSAVLDYTLENTHFNFYVSYFQDPEETERYNAIQGRAPRGLVGEKISPNNTYDLWRSSIVRYDNKYFSKNFRVQKVKLVNPTFVNDIPNYYGELIL